VVAVIFQFASDKTALVELSMSVFIIHVTALSRVPRFSVRIDRARGVGACTCWAMNVAINVAVAADAGPTMVIPSVARALDHSEGDGGLPPPHFHRPARLAQARLKVGRFSKISVSNNDP